MEAEVQIFGSQRRMEVRNGTKHLKQSRQSGNGTSDLWQSRKSGSAESELQIFSRQDKAEMRKKN